MKTSKIRTFWDISLVRQSYFVTYKYQVLSKVIFFQEIIVILSLSGNHPFYERESAVTLKYGLWLPMAGL